MARSEAVTEARSVVSIWNVCLELLLWGSCEGERLRFLTYGKFGIDFFKCLSGRTSRDSEVVEGLLSKGAFADWCT